MKKSKSEQSGNMSGNVELRRPDFAHQGYYTLPVLANGVDFCMLDPSGTMAFKDHIKGYYSFWFKRGRPHAADPTGIVKLTYSFISDKGKVEPGTFDQGWNVRGGRLVTRLSFFQLEMDVEVFLLDDHTLIEQFHIRECTARNGVLQFEQVFPMVTYTFKPVRSLGRIPGAVKVGVVGRNAVFSYRYSGEDGRFRGLGITGVRCLKGAARIGRVQCVQQPVEPATSISVSPVRAGTVLMRVTTVQDDLDSPAWRTEAKRVHAGYMARSPRLISGNQAAPWRDYFKGASFACTNDRVARSFDASLAACRMALHPNGSMPTALSVPCNHGMGTYWDAWFTHAGLLRTNRVAEARRIVDFWRSAYPLARRLARERGVGGARYPWVLREDGKPYAYTPEDDCQIHNNIVPAVNLYEQCLYTGDRALLAGALPLIQDCVRFLVEFALRKDSRGRWFLRELQAVDESNKMKRDEITTVACTLRGIRMIRHVGLLTGAAPDKDLLSCEPALEEVLGRLCVNGVRFSFEDAPGGGMATALSHIHLPGAKNFRRSIDSALAGCRETHGLGVGSCSRMRCATFPWVEGQFAWAMALNDDPRGFQWLERMLRYTSFFDSFPEYHWLHGEPSRDWYIGTFGVYLAALADLCLRRSGDRLQVFPLGVRRLPWRQGAFRGFRAPGGIVADAEWSLAGKIQVQLHNDSSDAQEFALVIGNSRAGRIRIKPGGRTLWSGTIDRSGS